jgi:hypothetical protein
VAPKLAGLAGRIDPQGAGEMPGPEGLVGTTGTGEVLRVREVWADNLEAEMSIIESIVEDYPFLAMDTEFPGVHFCSVLLPLEILSRDSDHWPSCCEPDAAVMI